MTATAIVLSSGQQGISQDGSRGMSGIFTMTPGTTATAGEAITSLLTPYFQSIDAIEVCGASASALFGKVPGFKFTPGGLLASYAVTLFMFVQDGDAGDLVPDNGNDLSAVGTIQLKITGKPA